MKQRHLLKLAALTALGLGVSGSLAYVLSDGRWRDGKTTIHVAIPGAATNGVLYSQAFEDAMATWNADTPFVFLADRSYRDPCSGYTRSTSGKGFPSGGGDGLNGVDFRADVCGNDLDSSTLAITLSLSQSGSLGFDYIVESDIIFNTRFDWSVYSGPRRQRIDLRRVALHELGHVMGLGHEDSVAAIMSSSIGDLYELSDDDIAGVTALYGAPRDCPVRAFTLNSQLRESLGGTDCSIRQLYGYGNDTSLVDTYRLDLQENSTLRLRMASTSLDSVLLITDPRLNPIEIFDDSPGSCDVDAQLELAAGSYLLLANTFVNPEKCAGNTGQYTLTVSDSPYFLMGNTSNTRSAAAVSAASFSGWARLDSANTGGQRFAAAEGITVEGRIDPDPAHIGQPGSLYVLVLLSNGQQLMMTPTGRFVPFLGLGQIKAMDQRLLQPRNNLSLVRGLRGSTTGLAGLGFQVFLGYALDSAPQDIHFGTRPIAFSIDP